MTQTLDPFDELAAMFLTSSDPSPTTTPPVATPSVAVDIELLVVGHLPVRAGLWLTPYADAIARTDAPVALVRLDGDEPMIQVVRGDGDLVSPSSCRSLREAILTLGPVVRRWIIRPSLRVEPAALAAAGATRVTILSGADQAAIVNAYRLIKELVATTGDDALAGPDNGPDVGPDNGPDIGLAVVGVEPAAAEEAVTRLSGTTRACLGVETKLATCLPRMDASIQAGQLRSFPGQGRPSLDEVIGWIRTAARHAASSPAPSPAPSPPAPPVEPPTASMDSRSAAVPPTVTVRRQSPPPPPSLVTPLPRPTLTPPPPLPTSNVVPNVVPNVAPNVTPPPPPPPPPPPLAAAVEPTRDLPEDPLADAVSRRTIRLDALAPQAFEEKTPPRPREPDAHGAPVLLATYVPGLTSIAPRCPGHERVELALDRAGAVHLLTREDSLRELGVVDRWVKQHHELLALACPDHTLTPGLAQRRHLFTDDPLSVADLHGGDAQLHLLAPVEVDGRVGWYAAALSRDVP